VDGLSRIKLTERIPCSFWFGFGNGAGLGLLGRRIAGGDWEENRGMKETSRFRGRGGETAREKTGGVG
jgi:hypothetical protein